MGFYERDDTAMAAWDFVSWHPGPTCVTELMPALEQIWIVCITCKVATPLATAAERVNNTAARLPREEIELGDNSDPVADGDDG